MLTATRSAQPATLAVARLHWPVLCCALLSLAAHAVLLDVMDASSLAGHRSAASTRPVGTAKPAMRFRTIAAASVAPAPTEAREVNELSAAESDAPGEASPSPSPSPSPAPAEQIEPMPQLALATPATATAPPGLSEYIPRPELTVPPTPQTPVVLAAPPSTAEPARRVGVLSLFIDETGRVHHIVPNEPRLPPPYEEAAREAFMTALFAPGQLDGRAVKSRIRIEVVFDNTPPGEP